MVGADSAFQIKISAVIDFNNTILLSANDTTSGQHFTYPLLVGADQDAPAVTNFYLTNTFQMVNMSAQYKTPSEVWKAVMTNPSNVVWSFGAVSSRGPPTSIPTPNVGDVLVL